VPQLRAQVESLTATNEATTAKLKQTEATLQKISAVSRNALKEFNELKVLYAEEVETRKDTEEYATNLTLQIQQLKQQLQEQQTQQNQQQTQQQQQQQIDRLAQQLATFEQQNSELEATLEKSAVANGGLQKRLDETSSALKKEVQLRTDLELQLLQAHKTIETVQVKYKADCNTNLLFCYQDVKHNELLGVPAGRRPAGPPKPSDPQDQHQHGQFRPRA